MAPTPNVTAPHNTAQTILSYLPLIIGAFQAAVAINSEVGHVDVMKIIADSLAAGSAVGMAIPEHHVNLIAAITQQVAPAVLDQINQARTKPAL